MESLIQGSNAMTETQLTQMDVPPLAKSQRDMFVLLWAKVVLLMSVQMATEHCLNSVMMGHKMGKDAKATVQDRSQGGRVLVAQVQRLITVKVYVGMGLKLAQNHVMTSLMME